MTSRARLRLRNEQVYEVAPLAVPPPNDPALPEEVMQYPSVAMFIEREQPARLHNHRCQRSCRSRNMPRWKGCPWPSSLEQPG